MPRTVPGAPRECGVPTPPCSAFRLLSSPAHSHAWPFAVAKATQVCTRIRTSRVAGEESPSSRDPTTRLDRYGGGRAIRDSPSDVGACHRVVRRHTCCSPVTRRSMRATQARATPGVSGGQPAPNAASKLSHEARRSSEECAGSHASHCFRLFSICGTSGNREMPRICVPTANPPRWSTRQHRHGSFSLLGVPL